MNDRCIHCGAIYGDQHWGGCRVLLESNIESLQSERDRYRAALIELVKYWDRGGPINEVIETATKALE